VARSKVELFEAIRRDHRREGLSIRGVADRYAVHRRMVRQALACAEPPPRKTPVRAALRLDPAKALIDAMLTEDLDAPQAAPHRSAGGVSMDYRIGAINQFTTGWMAYFRLADSARTFRDLDGWLRRRLRQIRWKEWKTTAARRHNLRIRGIFERNARQWAGSSKGYWRIAGSKVLQVFLPNTYWTRLGLKTLSQAWQRLHQTA
jgi:hypothetical protein